MRGCTRLACVVDPFSVTGGIPPSSGACACIMKLHDLHRDRHFRRCSAQGAVPSNISAKRVQMLTKLGKIRHVAWPPIWLYPGKLHPSAKSRPQLHDCRGPQPAGSVCATLASYPTSDNTPRHIEQHRRPNYLNNHSRLRSIAQIKKAHF